MSVEQPWVEPMLASLSPRRFSDPAWIFERKLDGVRTLAYGSGGSVRLMSRNRNNVSASYPEVVEALSDAVGIDDFVLDGEIVAFDGDSTSFSVLQRRIHQTSAAKIRHSGVEVFYYLFDLIRLDGVDARPLGVRDRKQVLSEAVRFEDPLRLSEHRDAEGEQMYAEACERGWEGIIAKRAAAPYASGRSTDWLKLKCVREQEMVVVGFTEPSGSRRGIGALLVGYNEEGRLRFGGKVGTGFSEVVLRELRDRLDGLEQEDPAIVDPPREPSAHWVRPELVVQVAFGEWTHGGRLRHPSYRGIRTDKVASEVVRES